MRVKGSIKAVRQDRNLPASLTGSGNHLGFIAEASNQTSHQGFPGPQGLFISLMNAEFVYAVPLCDLQIL